MFPSTFDVFAFLDQYLPLQPMPGALLDWQRAVLRKALASAERDGHWPITDLPLALMRAHGADEYQALVWAVACTLFYAYADVTDDAEDHDLADDPWAIAGWEQAVNTGNALLFRAFHLLGERLPMELATRLTAVLAQGGVRMTGGQCLDLAGERDRGGLEPYLATIRGKSGGSFGAYCEGAAIVSGEAPARAATHRDLGESLGMWFQTMNDTHELWGAGLSSDLVNGRLSFPLAAARECLEGEARTTLDALLVPGADRERQRRLVALLEAQGVRAYATLRIEVYRRRAESLAESLGLGDDPYMARLMAIPAFPESPVAI